MDEQRLLQLAEERLRQQRLENEASAALARLGGWRGIEAGVGLNAALASPFGDELARWAAEVFNHNSTAYDRAIDAAFNSSHVGGSALHHLVDGHHSLAGAFEAAAGVYPNDSVFQEMSAAVEHLLRDMASVSGINPVMSFDPGTLDSIQTALASSLGVDRSWTADLLTVNAPETLGGVLGALPLMLGWRAADAARFARLAGALGLSALWSANPLLAIVALVAAARSYQVSVNRGETLRSVMAAAGGAATSALIIGAMSVLPAWLGVGLLLGLVLVPVGAKLGFMVSAWAKLEPSRRPEPAW